MKRTFVLGLLGVFLVGLITSPGLADKGKEVLEKMIEASGGRKLLSGIKDMTMSGTMEITMAGMSGSMTIYSKEPNKMRMDMEVMGMVISTAYDGETAWVTNPATGATEELSGEAADQVVRQSLGNEALLLNPEKFGITYTYKGEEKVDDKDCVVLEVTYSDGHTATLYIDAKTYLMYKVKQTSLTQMGVEADSDVYLSDYKDVGGMKIAHTMKVFQDGQEAVTMTFTEVKFNTGIDDSLFKKD